MDDELAVEADRWVVSWLVEALCPLWGWDPGELRRTKGQGEPPMPGVA